MTVNAVGPVAAGEDILVTLVPQGVDEPALRSESIGDGVARVTTPESTDYVFLGREPVKCACDGVTFEGVAGALRLYSNEVHFVVSEAPGVVSYRGTTLRSAVPTVKIVPIAEVAQGKTFEVAAPPSTLRNTTLPAGFRISGDARCEVTVSHDRISGRSEGTGGFLYAPMPAGMTVLPMLVVDGQTYAPGTSGGDVIVPLMPGTHEFEVRALEQPPVFRNWQAW